ncbi:MAG TPA: hypothetical protein VND95_00495 [Stellaceae bacterium]|nr:hypothetical protein [Stellaceae bacterium]
MRNGRWGGVIGLGCLLLAGCAGRYASVTPDQAVILLETGQPLLGCREACLSEWRREEPRATQLAAAARWRELAALVLRVGYQDDLTLYYLGRAAEGIGNPGAAASFYRQSLQLSGTSISCQYLSHRCGDVALPGDAALRLGAIDRELARRYRRLERQRIPHRPQLPPSEAAPPAPSEAAAPVPGPLGPPLALPAAAPPPAPPPAPLPAPPPPAQPGAPHGSDYIEPPPIVR